MSSFRQAVSSGSLVELQSMIKEYGDDVVAAAPLSDDITRSRGGEHAAEAGGEHATTGLRAIGGTNASLA